MFFISSAIPLQQRFVFYCQIFYSNFLNFHAFCVNFHCGLVSIKFLILIDYPFWFTFFCILLNHFWFIFFLQWLLSQFFLRNFQIKLFFVYNPHTHKFSVFIFDIPYKFSLLFHLWMSAIFFLFFGKQNKIKNIFFFPFVFLFFSPKIK